MAWTTATEVIAAWIGDGAPDDLVKVDTWVGKAERLLRSKVPTLEARLDAGDEPDLLGNVRDVVTDMVHEVFRNPERIRQRQEGTGPFTGSVTFGGDTPGVLRVTADHVALLAPAGINTGAFSIDMIPSHSPFSSATPAAPLNSWELA